MNTASLILIRHATSEAVAGADPNVADPPLSESGRQAAANLSDLLKARQITKLYSSNLKRAKETAQIIAESLDVPLELRPKLRELSLLETDKAEEQDVYDEIDEITSSDPASTVAVVAHAGTIKAIVRHLLRLPMESRYGPSVAGAELLAFRKEQDGSWISVG